MWMLRARGQRENRRAGDKASILENTQIVINRMLVEMWTLKAILVRFQDGNAVTGKWRKGNPS